MTIHSITPSLEAYLPDGGAKVDVSDDFESVAVHLDLPTDSPDGGLHLLELSIREALDLTGALISAIENVIDHGEVSRIAAQMSAALAEKEDC